MAELSEDKRRAVELLCTRPDLSKEKIAEAVGVTRQTLNRWEKEPAFGGAMRAMGREPIPPADMREILAVLIKAAKAKDTAAAKLLLAWQARADGGPELVDTGPPVINFIVPAEDAETVDTGKMKALTGAILHYLADPGATREDFRKELQNVLPEETLALLPAPEETEEAKTLPRHKPDLTRLLSLNPKTAGGEASYAGVLTHEGETGCVYIQGPNETEAMFWGRVTKIEALESMRQ